MHHHSLEGRREPPVDPPDAFLPANGDKEMADPSKLTGILEANIRSEAGMGDIERVYYDKSGAAGSGTSDEVSRRTRQETGITTTQYIFVQILEKKVDRI